MAETTTTYRVANQDGREVATATGPDAATALGDWVATYSPSLSIFPVRATGNGKATVAGTPTGITSRIGFTATATGNGGGDTPPPGQDDREWASVIEDETGRWYWISRTDYRGMFLVREGAVKSARSYGYRVAPDDDPAEKQPAGQ